MAATANGGRTHRAADSVISPTTRLEIHNPPAAMRTDLSRCSRKRLINRSRFRVGSWLGTGVFTFTSVDAACLSSVTGELGTGKPFPLTPGWSQDAIWVDSGGTTS